MNPRKRDDLLDFSTSPLKLDLPGISVRGGSDMQLSDIDDFLVEDTELEAVLQSRTPVVEPQGLQDTGPNSFVPKSG
jgi:hypothetical protein